MNDSGSGTVGCHFASTTMSKMGKLSLPTFVYLLLFYEIRVRPKIFFAVIISD